MEAGKNHSGSDVPFGDKTEIIDTIKNFMNVNEPECVCGAEVICTAAVEGSKSLHVLSQSGSAVLDNGLSVLCRTDIGLEGCFETCTERSDGICDVTRNDIEDGEWKDFDETSNIGEGMEKLTQEKSYMMCIKGPGIIYFTSTGQVIASAWAMMDKLVSEDTFKRMNSRWNIENFKETYGDDIFKKMKILMWKANIVNKYSICMFLATIGTESMYGAKTVEDYKKRDKYTENVRGVV